MNSLFLVFDRHTYVTLHESTFHLTVNTNRFPHSPAFVCVILCYQLCFQWVELSLIAFFR